MMGGDMVGSPLRALEWLVELTVTAMLPALISGPVIVGILLIAQDMMARVATLPGVRSTPWKTAP
jgi:hypothetical protein